MLQLRAQPVATIPCFNETNGCIRRTDSRWSCSTTKNAMWLKRHIREMTRILAIIERVRLIQRVAKAFQSMGNNEGEMRIRKLSPPELGALKLEITYRMNGVLQAKLETETPGARNLLMENLPQSSQATARTKCADRNIRCSTCEIKQTVTRKSNTISHASKWSNLAIVCASKPRFANRALATSAITKKCRH